MIFQETLTLIECAQSVNKHIVYQPIQLSCGHSICKSCIPNDSSHEIKCSICNEKNQINLRLCKESLLTKSILKLNVNELFEVLEARFRKAIPHLQGTKNL